MSGVGKAVSCLVGSVATREEAAALARHLAKFEIYGTVSPAPSLLPGDAERWGVSVDPASLTEAESIVERGAPVMNLITGRPLKQAAWLGGPDLPFEIYLERFFR